MPSQRLVHHAVDDYFVNTFGCNTFVQVIIQITRRILLCKMTWSYFIKLINSIPAMNLHRDQYLHLVKKVGHISEFLFGIYWWTWKTTNTKLLKCANRRCNKKNVIFTIFYLQKIKKKTWRYHYFTSAPNLDDMIYSSWDYRVLIGNYGSFAVISTP